MEILGKYERAWRFRPTASYLGRTKTFVLNRCKSSSVEFDGRMMTIPENEYLQFVILTHNRSREKYFKKIIKKGDIVLDLGANIGYFTCLFAQLVGETGKVYAFEPEPTNFQLLKKNVEKNNYKNVILEEKAVSNKTHKTRLFLTDNGSMDHRLYQTDQKRNSVEVDVVKLDDYFKDKDISFDFIKSDLQGSDIAAIEGMKEIFKQSKNVKMDFEFAPHMAKGFGSDPVEFIESIEKLGFEFFENARYDTKPNPLHPNQVKKYAHENIHTHLLIIKE
jgi:FkbM family methyltransferase